MCQHRRGRMGAPQGDHLGQEALPHPQTPRQADVDTVTASDRHAVHLVRELAGGRQVGAEVEDAGDPRISGRRLLQQSVLVRTLMGSFSGSG